MAKTDFFKAFNDSSKLLEANLQGIAVPLAVIVLLSVLSGVAGFLFSQAVQFLPLVSLVGQSPRPMQSTGLGDYFMVALGVLVLLSLLVTWLTCALSLYVAQYFNGIMAKRKMPENYVGVIGGNLLRSLVMSLVMLVIFSVLFGVPAVITYLVTTQYTGIGILAGAVVMFLLAILLYGIACFFLAPLWIYYAVDQNGIVSSIRKSVALVRANLSAFFLLYVVFMVAYIGASVFSMVLCCFSIFVSPILMTLITVLYQITMMRMKLDSEAAPTPAKK